MNDMNQNRDEKKVRMRLYLLIAMAILSTAGIGVAIELLSVHYKTHTDPEYHSICAVNDAVNCETVALSPYSVFLGIPICIWGIVGYTFMLGLCIWMLSKWKKQEFLNGFLFALSSLFLATSILLAYISFTRINSLCLFCMTTYIINLILFVLALIVAGKSCSGVLWQVIESAGDLLDNPGKSAVLFGLSVAGLLSFRFAVDPYWENRDWKEIEVTHEQNAETGVHWTGAEDPELTVVEYSDYSCPFCRIAHRRVRSLVNAYKDKVQMIHRQFPLDHHCNRLLKRTFHLRSCEFAYAAECAGMQGMFWQMNDALFDAHDKYKPAEIDLKKLAEQVGLDIEEFGKCMKNGDSRKIVHEDIEEALKLELHATPSFLIDGEKIEGAVSKKKMEEFLEKGD